MQSWFYFLGEPDQNVIMWLDHRASEQATFINEKKHSILLQYGGSISLEQNPSKILWLKQVLFFHFLKLHVRVCSLWRQSGF